MSESSHSYDLVETPLGRLLLVARGSCLCSIRFAPFNPEPDWVRGPEVLAPAREQILAYFAGDRRAFELRLDPGGTPYQETVWAELQRIPYGETITYGDLAQRIGQPGGTQAVGGANHRNPIPIVIPCHRVVAARGELGGYAQGVEVKRRLLELEGALPPSLF